MPTKYFPIDANVDTTCDSVVADVIGDMSKTQGAGADAVGSTGSSGFTELFSWDIDVSGDSAGDGDHNCSINVTAADDAAQFEYRMRLVAINDTGCVEELQSTGTTFTGTGVKTDTLSLTPWSPANRLRLEVWGRKVAVHGNKAMTIRIEDADTFVDAPWGAAAPQRFFVSS